MTNNDNISQNQDTALQPEILLALGVLYSRNPPADFLTKASSAYEKARTRRMWQSASLGMLALVVFCTPALWFIALNWTAAAKIVAQGSFALSTIVNVTFTMWNSVPAFGTGVLLALWTLVFISGVMLARVTKLQPALK